MIDYKTKARDARLGILEMIYRAQSSHIGSNYSAVDLLTVLFEKADLENDKLIVSKGWIAAAVYWFLVDKGLLETEALEKYCGEDETKYIGLIEPQGIFGLEFAGGSMGYGMPAGVGFALAKKAQNEPGHIYVLMGDGEIAIGTTWESALIANHHRLNNLTVIVDHNYLQAMGSLHQILKIDSIKEKFEPLGWHIQEINGHKFDEIEKALSPIDLRDKPSLIIANTIKGKGVSFMANDNIWHYKAPNEDEYLEAKRQIFQS